MSKPIIDIRERIADLMASVAAAKPSTPAPAPAPATQADHAALVAAVEKAVSK